MVTIIALMIPVTVIVTGFFVLKGVQLGIRWGMEARQGQEPSMSTPIVETVQEIKESHIQKKEQELTNNLLKEWLEGEGT